MTATALLILIILVGMFMGATRSHADRPYHDYYDRRGRCRGGCHGHGCSCRDPW